jgi:hypothetical protein
MALLEADDHGGSQNQILIESKNAAGSRTVRPAPRIRVSQSFRMGGAWFGLPGAFGVRIGDATVSREWVHLQEGQGEVCLRRRRFTVVEPASPAATYS